MSGRRIAYCCPRVNLLKLYGPVLAEQARRGGPAPLLVVPVEPLITFGAKNRGLATGKRLDQVRKELGPDVEIVLVPSAERFLDVLQERGVAAVVAVGLRLPAAIRDDVLVPSLRRGVRWCSLGYLYEELLHLIADGAARLNKWDVATTFSPAVIDATARVFAARGLAGAERLRALQPIGFVECDQASGLDRDALRVKYGLPRDRPVTCFMTSPPFGYCTAPVLRALYREPCYRGPRQARTAARLLGRRWPEVTCFTGYRDIVAGLRHFADRHGALIAGKTRDKHRDPRYVRRAVDRLLTDGAYYPFRTLELLRLADLYVGVSSSTAFEAAFLGTRMRTIVPFPPDVYEQPIFVDLQREFFYESPGLWNAPGFSDVTCTYIAEDWAAFTAWAGHGTLETTVDPGVRSAVVERTLGFDDVKASARFLDLVETATGTEPRASVSAHRRGEGAARTPRP
jgi:hypothetical protein